MTVLADSHARYLVLGVGNILLTDDGIGVHIIESLRSHSELSSKINILDGGTLGLSLLPDIEDAAGLIIVDASEIGEKPGSMRVFESSEMDRQLAGKKRTVHEVAVSDLLATATMLGKQPNDRALIAIQPASTDWGLEPSAEVSSAIPHAVDAITSMIERWTR